MDKGYSKEFSVDLHARTTLPFDDENNITSELNLLVECKYRNPNISWLFLPEPNRPDYSPITLGTTIRIVDEFSRFRAAKGGTVSFDENVSFAFKGVEVDLLNAKAHDSEINRGLSQLRYALPNLVRRSIRWSLGGGSEEGYPFFFCPILLTTAKLYMAEEAFDISAVEAASDLKDFADEVPYLVIYSDYGPEFEGHCVGTFQRLPDLDINRSVAELHALREKNDLPQFTLPLQIAKSLALGQRYDLVHLFTQFVICSTDSFEDLVTEIKGSVEAAEQAFEALK